MLEDIFLGRILLSQCKKQISSSVYNGTWSGHLLQTKILAFHSEDNKQFHFDPEP